MCVADDCEEDPVRVQTYSPGLVARTQGGLHRGPDRRAHKPARIAHLLRLSVDDGSLVYCRRETLAESMVKHHVRGEAN